MTFLGSECCTVNIHTAGYFLLLFTGTDMSQLSGSASEVGPSSSQSDDGTSRIPPQPPPASSSGVSSSGTAAATDQSSRQTNLQRIQERKQQVYNWPHNKKLLKLAIYSACQVIAFPVLDNRDQNPQVTCKLVQLVSQDFEL
jgi:hypothetical protein